MKPELPYWDVSVIRGKRAVVIATVAAKDEASAIKRAIDELEDPAIDRKRLMARRSAV